MSKHRDSDLKERLMALKVNEPLKLKKESLVFSAPQERKEVPRNEAPPVVLESREATQNKAPQSHMTDPRTGVGSSESKLKSEAPQIEASLKGDARSELPQKEVSQNAAPPNEPPQKELPQREVSGFFKLSHRVFCEPLLRELSGDSFRIFLWLSSRAWRFPSSDGSVRASVGFIETHTGMSHATISRALKTLKEKGLISLVEVDFKKGNLWQISSIACNHPFPDTDPDGEPTHKRGPQNEAPRSSTEAASIRGGTQLKMMQQPPQYEADLRSIKKTKKYKETATKSFFVVSVPAPQSDDDFCAPEEAIALFEQELPSNAQEQIIAGYVSREYQHGFFPPARVVKTLAAKDWFRSQQSGTVSATA